MDCSKQHVAELAGMLLQKAVVVRVDYLGRSLTAWVNERSLRQKPLRLIHHEKTRLP